METESTAAVKPSAQQTGRQLMSPADLVLNSSQYGDDASNRKSFIAGLKAKSITEVRAERNKAREEVRGFTSRLKPNPETGVVETAALIGEGAEAIGKTESEAFENMQRRNDELGLINAFLLEQDYFGRVAAEAEQREVQAMATEAETDARTESGRIELSVMGRDGQATALSLIAGASQRFSDQLIERRNSNRSLNNLSMDYGDNKLVGSDLMSRNIDAQALFSKGNSSWPPQIVRSGRVVLADYRPKEFASIIPVVMMASGGYAYMKESAITDAVAPVAENTTFAEQDFTLTEQKVTAEKIAGFVAVTDEQLADVESAASYLNMRLPDVMDKTIDTQLMTGSGSSNQWKGFFNQTGITDTAKTGSVTLLDSYLNAFGNIGNTAFMQADFAAMNTLECVRLQQVKDSDGRYLFGSPHMQSMMSLWGVPLVISHAIANNKALVGVISQCAMGEMQGVRVMFGYSGTDFVQGKQTIRIDMRGNLIVFRPTAFRTLSALNTADT